MTTCALVCYIHVVSCIYRCGGYEHRVHVYQNDPCVRSPNKMCTPKLKGHIPQKGVYPNEKCIYTTKKLHTQMKSAYPKIAKMAYIKVALIGASLSEPHLGPYSGCGLCHIIMIIMVVVYRTSCPMRMRGVYVESSKVSRGKRVAQGKRERYRCDRYTLVAVATACA